jgi:hypothetical protein
MLNFKCDHEIIVIPYSVCIVLTKFSSVGLVINAIIGGVWTTVGALLDIADEDGASELLDIPEEDGANELLDVTGVDDEYRELLEGVNIPVDEDE